MKFNIIHETNYTFDDEVFIEPHYLRFRPRVNPHSVLESFNLKVMDAPKGLSEQLDEENNALYFCWFEGMHRSLTIRAESIVESKTFNPFDFIFNPGENSELPIRYTPNQNSLLLNALTKHTISNELIEYSSLIKSRANKITLQFISELTTQIHSDFELIYREAGDPFAASETYTKKEGSCRDLAWMLVQLLRYHGIASRFVSGYFYIESENPSYELHAWVEAYLPGGGWIGIDPSHGIFVGHTHIPIAASVNSENTLPVIGSIRGSASHSLTTDLKISVIEY